jgi:IS5 family transposase
MSGIFGEEQDRVDAMEIYLKKLSSKDPLVALNNTIQWEIFSADLRTFRKSLRKYDTGRPPFDPLLMFKILLLQSLYNLSDESMEFMIQDRLSFMNFLGLSSGDRVPDAKTIWFFRNELSKANMVERLFSRFKEYLASKGLMTHQGQIIDASIVESPRQRTTKSEREELAAGKTPANWSAAKSRQKDSDATWTVRNDRSYFGYKNHVQADSSTKLVSRYSVTTAGVHDSQVFEELLEAPNEGNCATVYADKAYYSAANEEILRKHKIKSHVLRRATRGNPLSEDVKAKNVEWSRIRSRVEHVFGIQYKQVGNLLVRAVGYTRVRASIGLRNLGYNMNRLVFLKKTGVLCFSGG